MQVTMHVKISTIL